MAPDTGWRQIDLLYEQLLRYEPTPIVEANRAIAVAMAGGPQAGLDLLLAIAGNEQLRRWRIRSTSSPTGACRCPRGRRTWEHALEGGVLLLDLVHRRVEQHADGRLLGLRLRRYCQRAPSGTQNTLSDVYSSRYSTISTRRSGFGMK